MSQFWHAVTTSYIRNGVFYLCSVRDGGCVGTSRTKSDLGVNGDNLGAGVVNTLIPIDLIREQSFIWASI